MNETAVLSVTTYIPGRYEILYLGTKLHTQVGNYLPRYVILYPATNLYAQIGNYIPTHVGKFILEYKITYPGRKLHNQVET
jgi:hypothetical protein